MDQKHPLSHLAHKKDKVYVGSLINYRTAISKFQSLPFRVHWVPYQKLFLIRLTRFFLTTTITLGN